LVDTIKSVDIEHAIMSSDLGQIHNPSPVEGFRMFIQILLENGISEEQIKKMSYENPGRLLGMK